MRIRASLGKVSANPDRKRHRCQDHLIALWEPMSPFRFRALLLAPALTFMVWQGSAAAVETWVGADGEIRIVPGTEDPVPTLKSKPQKSAATSEPTPEAAKAATTKTPVRLSNGKPVAKPLHGKPVSNDPGTTGAVTPQNQTNPDPNVQDPNDPQYQDKQRMQPRQAMPKPAPLPPRPVTDSKQTIDPGNALINSGPKTDTAVMTNEPDYGPGEETPDPVLNAQLPGALPTNQTDPVIGTNPSGSGLGPLGSRTQPTPAGARNTGNQPTDQTRPGQAAQAASPMRLRPSIPTAAPVQPMQPQPPTGITSSIAQVPQLATAPNPRLVVDDPLTDPQSTAYDQRGIRVNSFIWRPAIELSAGANSNIQAVAGGNSSSALRVAPELIGQSDWSRHQLGFDLHGSFTEFPQYPQLARPTVSASANGRIDLGDETQITLKTAYGLDKLPSSSALNAAGTTGAGLQQTYTGSAGLTRDVGRFAITLRGEVDRTDYQLDSTTQAETPAASLNNTNLIGALRGSYSVSAGVKPFIEIQTNALRYDAGSQVSSTSGVISHDGNGAAFKGGVALDFGPLLKGEASSGYGFETPLNNQLQTLRAFTVDENLVWSPTRLTRITVTTVTAIEPTLLAGASGAVSRTMGLKVSDDILRNLTVDVGGSYLARHYTGVYRTENLDEVTGALTWKINPTLQTFVRGTYDAFASSAHTDDYNALSVFAGVRLQQ